MTNTPKRHPKADLIHAWAEGAAIQVFDPDDGWMPCAYPSWTGESKYRIAPVECMVRLRHRRYLAMGTAGLGGPERPIVKVQMLEDNDLDGVPDKFISWIDNDWIDGRYSVPMNLAPDEDKAWAQGMAGETHRVSGETSHA